MFVGYLSTIKNEMALYPAQLQVGLKFLLETDLSSLPLGRHEIQGDKIYASVAEYETEPYSERRAEAHAKYLDIQYVCSGEEFIGAAPLKAEYEVEEDCLNERDVIFYKKVTEETKLTLLPGMFAVLFPWDVHRPNCTIGGKASKVRKIVVKVAIDGIK
ncbi:MAG: hypothetical protein H6Q73_4422 [Firmicutes bacterium]|nr:hypothetical protein [Bacillota bacterium]